MKLLSREEVRLLDQTVLKEGVSQKDLIQEVGEQLAKWLVPQLQPHEKVLILQGPGNNGQDASVLAKQIASHPVTIEHLQWSEIENFRSKDLSQYDWIIDGIFGVGLDRELSSNVQSLLRACNESRAKRVAIDIPTGLDSNTGTIHGALFSAHHTLTIAAPKRGLYLLPGAQYCGEIHVIPIATLEKPLSVMPSNCLALPIFDPLPLLPKMTSHKYNRGVVAVAMSSDFPGAALLAAYAAQQSGSGYVKVLCPEELLPLCQIQHPSLVFIPYKSKKRLRELIEQETFNSLVIGAGWKKSYADIKFNLDPKRSYIFDGGFLTSETLHNCELKKHPQLILTPHFGELKRLLGQQHSNAITNVEKICDLFKGIIVAKGYDSLVAQKNKPYHLATWNAPSLSTAGSGDILSGLIASVTAQDSDIFSAVLRAIDTHRRLGQMSPHCTSPLVLLRKLDSLLNAEVSSSPKE